MRIYIRVRVYDMRERAREGERGTYATCNDVRTRRSGDHWRGEGAAEATRSIQYTDDHSTAWTRCFLCGTF